MHIREYKGGKIIMFTLVNNDSLNVGVRFSSFH